MTKKQLELLKMLEETNKILADSNKILAEGNKIIEQNRKVFNRIIRQRLRNIVEPKIVKELGLFILNNRN